MSYGLKDETINNLQNVFESFPQISNVILYGSRAKGNYRNGSDIDLTIKGDNLSQDFLYNVIDRVEDLYLPYKLDLSIFDHIDNEDLIDHIKRVGIVFYQRKN